MKEYIVSENSYEYEMRRYDELRELIRCKDCKHETDHDCPINWGKTGEDFCSFAEKREE